MITCTLYITEAGQQALQSSGLAGWTRLVLNLSTTLPTPPGYGATSVSFTAPTYTGYGADTVAFTSGFVNSVSNQAYAESNLLRINGPSAGAGTDVLGFELNDSSINTVFAWGQFSQALPEQLSTDLISLVILLYSNQSSSVNVIQ